MPSRNTKPIKSDPNWLKPSQLGRPYSRTISEAFRAKLAEIDKKQDKTKAEIVVERVMEAIEKGKDSTVIAGSSFVADRTEGKAPQALTVTHSIDENALKHIAELADKFL